MDEQNQNLLNMMLLSGGRGFAPQPTAQQLKTQGGIKAGAGIVDVIQGKLGQRRAEQDIEELGAQQEELINQYKDMSAPGLMDPNTVAAATRNAAILGGVPAQQDSSSELAAAKMAMEAGADPATIQRNLAQAQQMESAQAAGQANQAFQQGLGFAQQDAQNQFAKQQENMMMDIDDVSAALEAAQRESLMGQQLAQRGASNIMSGGTQLFQGIKGQRAIDEAEAKKQAELEAAQSQAMANELGDTLNFSAPSIDYQFGQGINNPFGFNTMGGLDNVSLTSQEQGGVVQKTPGEFDHDTNDMVLMAPTENGLVDTGIRQTGGEFVLNPEQADGLEEAYDGVDPNDPTYEQLLALYKAARFLEEPQFDDDYAA